MNTGVQRGHNVWGWVVRRGRVGSRGMNGAFSTKLRCCALIEFQARTLANISACNGISFERERDVLCSSTHLKPVPRGVGSISS